MDLRAEFAYQLPTRLICDLFGVPTDQRPEMLRVIDAVPDTNITPEQADATSRDLCAAMAKLIDTKGRSPSENITSRLLAAHEVGDPLAGDELIYTLTLMIGAGSETAVAVIELLRHPDQFALV